MPKSRLLFWLAGACVVAYLGGAPAAHASPSCTMSDPLLCQSPSKVYYCPDNGRMVPWLGACPSLVVGPYAPGGLQPNGGLAK